MLRSRGALVRALALGFMVVLSSISGKLLKKWRGKRRGVGVRGQTLGRAERRGEGMDEEDGEASCRVCKAMAAIEGLGEGRVGRR